MIALIPPTPLILEILMEMDTYEYGGYESKLAVWYENDGKGNFTRHVLSRDQMAYDTMIDLDGDGEKDILVAGQRSLNVVWFKNPGK